MAAGMLGDIDVGGRGSSSMKAAHLFGDQGVGPTWLLMVQQTLLR